MSNKSLPRSAARLSAVQALFQYDANPIDRADLIAQFHTHRLTRTWEEMMTGDGLPLSELKNPGVQEFDEEERERARVSMHSGTDDGNATNNVHGDDRNDLDHIIADTAVIDISHFDDIIFGVTDNLDRFDGDITDNLDEKWTMERIDRVMVQILRAGAFELYQKPGIKSAVIINEYIDIAHGFLSKKETGFINALLDKLARQYRG